MSILHNLEEKALTLGANGVKEIPIDRIPIEDEIIELCKAPLCEGFGKSVHCPPHAMKPGQARRWVHRYKKALLFKIDVPPGVLLSKDRFNEFKKIYVIAAELEKLATSNRCSAFGLAAGSCKPVFCKNDICSALRDHGECRYPQLARPSMEAIGINVFKLVSNAGWEINRILKKSNPRDIPSAILAGLLLVSSQKV